MWSCETCGRPNKSNPLICEVCGASAPGADPALVSLALQRDLPMESHLRALAFWYRVGAVVMGVSFLALFGVLGRAFLGATPLMRGSGAMWAGAFGYVAMFVVALAVGSYVLGHFLGRFVNGARIAAGVLTIVGMVYEVARFGLTALAYNRLGAIYDDASPYSSSPSLMGPLFGFVLVTIWSGAIAWTLLSGRAAQVCAPAYRTVVARTAGLKAPLAKSPFFVVPLVVTVLAALVMLRLLLQLHSYSRF